MTQSAAPSILISAGEPSGDLHGAALTRALQRRLPGSRVRGVGGPAMRAAGADIMFPMENLSGMGFAEVAGSIPRHYLLYRRLRGELRTGRYDLAVLIDYPGFHLRLAGAARAAGVPVLYYIAPQLWAWRAARAGRMRAVIDRLAVILPFEAEFFTGLGMSAEFVGHPLLDRAPLPSREPARRCLGLPAEVRVLGIFPGSRPSEVARHWPLFRAAALKLVEEGSCDRVVVAAQPGGSYPEPGAIVLRYGDPTWVLAAADVALAKSGTATLEAALAGTPMVVAYTTSRLSRAIALRAMTVSSISLVNLVAGRPIVPEFWRDPVRVDPLVDAVRPLFESGGSARQTQLAGLAGVRQQLGAPGASDRVAGMAAELLAV
jgi:lipid-A-disaccharide synthase